MSRPRIAYFPALTEVRGWIYFACERHVMVRYRGTAEALLRSGVISPYMWEQLGDGRRRSRKLDESGHSFTTRGFWGKPPAGCALGEVEVHRVAEPPEAALSLPGLSAQDLKAAIERELAEDARRLAERPENMPKRLTAAEWKADRLKQFAEGVMTVGTFAEGLGYADFTWEDGRFSVDPHDASDLVVIAEAFHGQFMKRFATARIIDHHRESAAHGPRLVVDNTR